MNNKNIQFAVGDVFSYFHTMKNCDVILYVGPETIYKKECHNKMTIIYVNIGISDMKHEDD